ncbi:MAG: diacylglycerol kinase family lipid kinase [Chloroflexi bacterium]|nr:diacylglycerol kinase family lipid kinase [Chloroflexota bacterium]
MKVQVIYNPVAGQRDVRAEVKQVAAYLQARGWQVQSAETRAAGEATEYARQAVLAGCHLVLAAGGDGTLNEVVNGLAESPVVLGVLPIGTSNVWAKEIGIPVSTPLHHTSLLQALHSLEEGAVYPVDTGQANERRFLLWSGIGFDAKVVADVEPQYEAKRRWGALVFIVAGVALATNFVGTRARITLDGQYLRQRVILILVSNTQKYGGGLIRPAPQACFDDGYFDVFVCEGQGPLATVLHVLGLLTEQHMRNPRVSYHRVRHLKIETNRPMPVHLDGAPAGETPLEIRVLPKSLNVLLPRKVHKDLFADPNTVGVPLAEFVRTLPEPAQPQGV